MADKQIVLKQDETGLILTDGEMTLRGDFSTMKKRLRHNNLSHELLVKAAKIKNLTGTPTAIDATAGMGQDAFLLAAAGFDVQLFEKDPVIAALLKDALHRGMQDSELAPVIQRMHLHEEDSIPVLKSAALHPDIILLDPMFPERQKSALVKKKFQLLHQIERPCDDEMELLDAAMTARPHKIIIKRPLKGPYLAGKKPSWSLRGKAVRYDCILISDPEM